MDPYLSAPLLSRYYSDKNQDGRFYVNPVTKTTAPSVTSILKFEAKDNLVQWAASLTAEFYAKNPTLPMQRSTEDAKRAGQYYWKNFRDERAEVGTGVHEYIETLNMGGFDFPELDDEQLRIIDRYQEFLGLYTINPVLSEATLWDHVGEVAGTADGFWEIDGPEISGLFLIDLKTSKNTWPGHWMQLAKLRHMPTLMTQVDEKTPGAALDKHPKLGNLYWVEEDAPKTDGAAIIHLREDKWGFLKLDPEEETVRLRQFDAYRALWEEDAILRKMGKDVGF